MNAHRVVAVLLEGEDDELLADVAKAGLSSAGPGGYMQREGGNIYAWREPVRIAGRPGATLAFTISLDDFDWRRAPYLRLSVVTPTGNVRYTVVFDRVLRPPSPDAKTNRAALFPRIERLFLRIKDLVDYRWNSIGHLSKYAKALLAVEGVDMTERERYVDQGK